MFRYLFLLLPFVISDATAQVVHEVSDIEVNALFKLYNSTNGAGWRNKQGWLTDAPVGEWYGVTVEGECVVKIVLRSNNLRGLTFLGVESGLHRE